VVVLGTDALASVDPTTFAVTVIATVAPTGSQDLQMSDGAVWVANGDAGEVTRYDLATGEASDPIYVGGSFTAVAIGEGSVWTVSGDDSDRGVLTHIDADTAEILGRRISLGGRPYDITTGAGAVWIVNNSTGSVTRIQP
jgi:streptogramin lyase